MGLCSRMNSLSSALTPPVGTGVIPIRPLPLPEEAGAGLTGAGCAGVGAGYVGGAVAAGGNDVGFLWCPQPTAASNTRANPTSHAHRSAHQRLLSPISCVGLSAAGRGDLQDCLTYPTSCASRRSIRSGPA